MKSIEEALARFDGGRVLDVATQEGRFVNVLKSGLRSVTEIVGIDVNEKAIEAARSASDAGDIRFSVMDAEKLEFADETFDTVSISASLHHMRHVGGVLDEMKRVLKPGGRYIIVEMHRDAQTEPELTSSYLHRWAAEVDTASGRLHKQTLTRAEILAAVDRLGMQNPEDHEFRDMDGDPLDEERVSKVEEVIGIVAKRADASGDARLVERADELLERLREVGIRGEPVIFVTGEKPA